MDYKLMGTDEDSYYIEFSTEQGAIDWLSYMKEKFPSYIEQNGIHIVKSKEALKKEETLRLIDIGKETIKFYPVDEWNEDLGLCLFWRLPIEEPPMITDPITSSWIDNYFTHFTKLNLACDAIQEQFEKDTQ